MSKIMVIYLLGFLSGIIFSGFSFVMPHIEIISNISAVVGVISSVFVIIYIRKYGVE